MERSKVPNIYDIEFESVYDINFVTLNKDVQEIAKISPAGGASDILVGSIVVPDAVKLQNIEEESFETSLEMRALASKSIEIVLSTSQKKVITITKFIEAVFEERPHKDTYHDFKYSLIQDDRLEYIGSRDFRILNRQELYWPHENPNVDHLSINSLVDKVVEVMLLASWGHFKVSNILGIAKAKSGDYLSQEEINELFALLSTHPRIRPLEDGTFSVRRAQIAENDTSEDELKITSPGVTKTDEFGPKPLSDRQLRLTLDIARSSEAVKRATTQAKRIANPHRRAKIKPSKLRGKSHGKKQNLDQIIANLVQTGGS